MRCRLRADYPNSLFTLLGESHAYECRRRPPSCVRSGFAVDDSVTRRASVLAPWQRTSASSRCTPPAGGTAIWTCRPSTAPSRTSVTVAETTTTVAKSRGQPISATVDRWSKGSEPDRASRACTSSTPPSRICRGSTCRGSAVPVGRSGHTRPRGSSSGPRKRSRPARDAAASLQVGYTDRLVGRILERLRQAGLFDRAMVVVTADHGVSFRSRPITPRHGHARPEATSPRAAVHQVPGTAARPDRHVDGPQRRHRPHDRRGAGHALSVGGGRAADPPRGPAERQPAGLRPAVEPGASSLSLSSTSSASGPQDCGG